MLSTLYLWAILICVPQPAGWLQCESNPMDSRRWYSPLDCANTLKEEPWRAMPVACAIAPGQFHNVH